MAREAGGGEAYLAVSSTMRTVALSGMSVASNVYVLRRCSERLVAPLSDDVFVSLGSCVNAFRLTIPLMYEICIMNAECNLYSRWYYLT